MDAVFFAISRAIKPCGFDVGVICPRSPRWRAAISVPTPPSPSRILYRGPRVSHQELAFFLRALTHFKASAYVRDRLLGDSDALARSAIFSSACSLALRQIQDPLRLAILLLRSKGLRCHFVRFHAAIATPTATPAVASVLIEPAAPDVAALSSVIARTWLEMLTPAADRMPSNLVRSFVQSCVAPLADGTTSRSPSRARHSSVISLLRVSPCRGAP